MTLAAGLLALALLVQPKEIYHWRDAKGQRHVTNTPPPPGAELMDAPPPPAVEPGRAEEPPLRPRPTRVERLKNTLTPAQRTAWGALEQHLAKARAAGDQATVRAMTNSLIDDSLWGTGLWAVPLLPVLSLALAGLMGWWLAVGLKPGAQLSLIAGFLLIGLSFGQLLLSSFLYHPQAERLRQNMELLSLHSGTGRELRPQNQALLQQRYEALDRAADPLQAPWRFPAQVSALRRDMQQVMVDP